MSSFFDGGSGVTDTPPGPKGDGPETRGSLSPGSLEPTTQTAPGALKLVEDQPQLPTAGRGRTETTKARVAKATRRTVSPVAAAHASTEPSACAEGAFSDAAGALVQTAAGPVTTTAIPTDVPVDVVWDPDRTIVDFKVEGDFLILKLPTL